jgi:hypothetical protein
MDEASCIACKHQTGPRLMVMQHRSRQRALLFQRYHVDSRWPLSDCSYALIMVYRWKTNKTLKFFGFTGLRTQLGEVALNSSSSSSYCYYSLIPGFIFSHIYLLVPMVNPHHAGFRSQIVALSLR